MARSRTIKPGFFVNEVLCSFPFETRLLFAGLWTIADRSGRLEDRPKRIHAELFPYDPGLDVGLMLDVLDEAGFIYRYTINGDHFIQIAKWFVHQNPHPHEVPSKLPALPVDLTDIKGCRDFSRHCRDMSNHWGSVCNAGSSGSSSLQDLQALPFSATANTAVAETSSKPEPQRKSKSASLREDEVLWWFESEFWPAYWRRVDRAAALKMARRHADTPDKRILILAAVHAQSAYYLSRDPEHRPHAATWLSKERYNDDPALLQPNGQRDQLFSERRQARQDEMFAELMARELEKQL